MTSAFKGLRRNSQPSGHRHRWRLKPLLALLVIFAFTGGATFLNVSSAGATGGNEECPTGTTMWAKYEWKGSSYQAESGGEIISVSGTATGGTFSVLKDGYKVQAVVVKGSTDAKIDYYDPPVTSGSFDNSGLETKSGNTPAVSNVKVCGSYEEPTTDACPDLTGDQPEGTDCTQPQDDRQTKVLDGVVDCDADTYTVEHQERTRSYTWDGDSWEPGAWSAWTTYDTTVTEVTDEQCPPPPAEPDRSNYNLTSLCKPAEDKGQFRITNNSDEDESYKLYRVGGDEVYNATVKAGSVDVLEVPWYSSSDTWKLEVAGLVYTKAIGDNELCEQPPPPQPPTKPADDRQTKVLDGVVDCDADTYTVEHQERTRSYTWDGDSWEPGAWSAWKTYDTTVTEATDEQCPSPTPPPVVIAPDANLTSQCEIVEGGVKTGYTIVDMVLDNSKSNVEIGYEIVETIDGVTDVDPLALGAGELLTLHAAYSPADGKKVTLAINGADGLLKRLSFRTGDCVDVAAPPPPPVPYDECSNLPGNQPEGYDCRPDVTKPAPKPVPNPSAPPVGQPTGPTQPKPTYYDTGSAGTPSGPGATQALWLSAAGAAALLGLGLLFPVRRRARVEE